MKNDVTMKKQYSKVLYPLFTTFFTLIIFFSSFNTAYGQLFPPSSVDVALQAQVDSTFQVDPAMMDSTTMANLSHTVQVIVALADTGLVANVHVKLVNNGTVIFNGSIPFSTTSSQTTAYTLTRQDKIIYLDFGTHVGAINFYAEAYTEDGQGGISSTVNTD